VIANSENFLDRDIFNDPEAGLMQDG